ncbi:formate dehydrogenase accessory sulfurtransferase FdhD [Alkalicoccus urumqiensis]|uniref:Sulfur carrier protein FdhD n=1 Tax=Alkalicoccus urumqiensis TaxID=1548213 RepID=A0A2P6MLT3_ALKUR|nr:formate dehydrogenase accessory sulfurtransferase FdhD [Alkalicoccus urumqiensis]
MDELRMSRPRTIVRFTEGRFEEVEDEIVLEEPLTVMLNGEEFATLVCTPADQRELVLGFLASEGVIRLPKEIRKLTLDESKGFAYVELFKEIELNQQDYTKRVIGSCCGKGRQFYFQNDARTAKTSMTRQTLSPEQCIGRMREMQAGSHVFKGTGGVHNAALATPDELIVSRTDIGRHNALDKLYGYCLENGISVRDKVLVFSGRLSSEVLTKAAKIGVGIVLSKSAPTDLAIRMAEELQITAVGFIRGGSFNVYSHAHRIQIKEERPMSSCPIDHTPEDTKAKLDSQKEHLPAIVYAEAESILQGTPDQEQLNELFHLLKKYDLAEPDEQKQREQGITALAGKVNA